MGISQSAGWRKALSSIKQLGVLREGRWNSIAQMNWENAGLVVVPRTPQNAFFAPNVLLMSSLPATLLPGISHAAERRCGFVLWPFWDGDSVLSLPHSPRTQNALWKK